MSNTSGHSDYAVSVYEGTDGLPARLAAYREENDFTPEYVRVDSLRGLLAIGHRPERGPCLAVWFPDAKCGLSPKDPATRAVAVLLVTCGYPADSQACLADLMAKFTDAIFVNEPETKRLIASRLCRHPVGDDTPTSR